MLGYIVSHENVREIQDALDEHIIFERVGEFTADEFINHCQAAASITLDVLIVDINCTSDDVIIKGIQHFRMKSNARIILIAPGREPGDPTISRLVGLGVWDIVAPALATDDSEEDKIITESLKMQLKMSYSYGNAARWDVSEVLDKQPKYTDRKKSIEIPSPRSKEKIIYQDRIVGTVIIAVGSTGKRTGCTHSAIQIANFLNDSGYKTACVEFLEEDQKSCFSALNSHDFFEFKGINFYTIKPSMNDKYFQVLSAGYQYVVLDVSQIFHQENQIYSLSPFSNEFFRADLQIITATPAIWDIDDFLFTLDAFYHYKIDREFMFLINLADDEGFKEYSSMLSKYQKKQLKITFFKNVFSTDPFTLNVDQKKIYRSMLDSVLPREKRKKFLFF